MDDQQPITPIVAVGIVALLILLFLGAAIFIVNPGAFSGLTAGLSPTNTPLAPTATLVAVLSTTEPPTATVATTATLPPTLSATPAQPDTATVEASPTSEVTDIEAASPTATVPPSQTPKPSATPKPTLIPFPTITPSPVPSLAPTLAATNTNTAVPLNTDRAEFVADVTVPDGTVFSPGTTFTKTWRIKNVGQTTWTTDYRLESTVGSQMAVNKQVAFSKTVAPGETIDLSMDMIAPSDPGDHTALFQFRNAQGQPFGVGPQFNEAIYVKIVVGGVTPTP